MKILTQNLIGPALDWAVEAATEVQFKEGRIVKICRRESTTPAWIEVENSPGSSPYFHRVSTSTDWSQGGPIIERERIDCISDPCGSAGWMGRSWINQKEIRQFGPTPLVAAMRCYVASQLGNEVDIPDDLL